MTRNEKSILGIAILLMSLTLWLPIWRIEIWAPQYPEGLSMQIGASSIGGNVDQINLLNHYIGMRKIIPSQIPELIYIPWVIMGILGLGVLVILSNRKKWGKVWLGLISLASVAGMVDFYNWGFNYGHNLDPNAPIKIPGFSYQPPLFGYKKILNIEAYSWPDLGTYAFALGLGMAFWILFWDHLFRVTSNDDRGFLKDLLSFGRKKISVLSSIFLFTMVSCTDIKPEPLQAEVDQCHVCHMKIADSRFGGEVITKKGRVYKFDSIQCLHEYLSKTADTGETVFVADYFAPATLVNADSAHFLNSATITSPMGPGIIASKELGEIEKLRVLNPGKVTDWKGLSFSSF